LKGGALRDYRVFTPSRNAKTMKLFRLVSLLALLLVVGTLVPVGMASTRSQAPNAIVNIQFLNVSDWHAQLDPQLMTVETVPNVPVGGAAQISSYWKADRLANPNTITLTSGDDFGASPPLSGYFNEVPGVTAERMMGMSINTFGNHNFDAGTAHLQQMIDLAGSPTAPLTPSSIYNNGTPFPYVAANLINTTGVLTGVDRYKIFDMSGVKVAVIGIVNPEAPELVIPGAFGPIEITDPVTAAMSAKAEAQAAGAQVFVVITHMGLTAPNSGPLIDFANGVTGFDIIFGDHTDVKYSGTINGALVTENLSKGVSYLKVNLSYDTTTNTVTNKTHQFVTPVGIATPSMPTVPAQDPAIVAMLKPYRDQLTIIFDAPVGKSAGIFPRNNVVERTGEAAVGNLVTDAMRDKYDTDIAFTNGGGLRSTMPSSYAPKVPNSLCRPPTVLTSCPNSRYDLVIGDVFTLLPFGNSIVVRPVTGGKLWQALEFSVSKLPATFGGFGQISGFRFDFDPTRPAFSRVLNVQLNNGTKILSDTTIYSMATNNFTNVGGDGYTMFNDGTGTTQDVLADIVRDYIVAQGVITPTLQGRINRIPTISAIANQAIDEDTSLAPLAFTVSDTETLSNTLVVTATSSNTTLVANASIVIGGSNGNRTVSVTPNANASGVTTITIGVNDGHYTTTKSFLLTVNSVPDAPVLAGVADVTTPEDTQASLNFTASDVDSADILTVTATSSNPALVLNSGLVVSGTGPNYTLTITPIANASGTAVITVAVNDGTQTVTDTFDLTVTAVNDLPTATAIADQTVLAGESTGALAFTIGDIETAVAGLTVTATSSNTNLVPNANVVIGGSGANRTVTVTPLPGLTGTTTISVMVNDGTATTTRTFTVTVVLRKVFLPLILR
jgi:2',3'-cyclic-nucleotide 2'-phosphodiesterase (5'-nucleotidase family)